MKNLTSVMVVLAFLGATGWWLTVTGKLTMFNFAAGDSYKFFAHQADGKTPVAYDPCRPIHYVIRRQGEPAGGDQIVVAAVSRVSEVTGLKFAYDGTTSDGPSGQRSSSQTNGDGSRWPPVLISWVTSKEDPDFADDEVLGEGGSQSVRVPNGPSVFVTGAVALDAEKLARILREPDGNKVVRAVVLHELGHLVGLDHVDAKSQLMYPRNQRGVTDFGAGDLTGLAALGKGACSSDG